MSRFNAQAQKGYYKTPTHLLPVISRYVSCSDPENARVLDPCAGEGEAIEHLGLGLGLSTSRIYANELDEPRALACEKRGLVSLCGDAVHELDAPLGGFQLVFLNPPYDEEADGSGRTECKFLSTIRFLQQNGILVYIVPLFVLQTRNVFERLTRSFHNIGMLRFPDPDYAVYGQCVLIACHGRGDMEQEKERLAALLEHPPVDRSGSPYAYRAFSVFLPTPHRASNRGYAGWPCGPVRMPLRFGSPRGTSRPQSHAAAFRPSGRDAGQRAHGWSVHRS